MKTKLINCLLTLVVILALPAKAIVKDETSNPPPERINHTMLFYNTGDGLPAVPFLAITLIGIPKTESEKLKKWREEINEKMAKFGGVKSQADFEKVGKVLAEYCGEFLKAGSLAFTVEFPRAIREARIGK